jgi:hypothetical protein
MSKEYERRRAADRKRKLHMIAKIAVVLVGSAALAGWAAFFSG